MKISKDWRNYYSDQNNDDKFPCEICKIMIDIDSSNRCYYCDEIGNYTMNSRCENCLQLHLNQCVNVKLVNGGGE